MNTCRNSSTFAALVVSLALGAADAAAQAGRGASAATFEARCATCHTASPADSRTPDRASLRNRTPEAVLQAITSGVMMAQAEGLTVDERRRLAEFVSGRALGVAAASTSAAALCKAASAFAPSNSSPMWNGWGVDAANTRFQPATSAGLAAATVPRLKLKWAFGFAGGSMAYGQPTLVAGRVFVGSDNGFVYSLDAATGCTHWAFDATAGVRTAISIGPSKAAPSGWLAYFGDSRARVYAVDAGSGARVWSVQADEHRTARITGAPMLVDNRLIVPVSSFEEAPGGNSSYECCTFRGSVVAFDAETGREIWKTYTITDQPKPTRKNSAGGQLWGPSGAAVWSAPTIDLARRVVYVGTGNAYSEPAAETTDAVLALDLDTGRLLWTRQLTPDDVYVVGCTGRMPSVNCRQPSGPDFDLGTSPVLRSLGGGRSIVIAGQKSGVVYGLDPDKQGAIVWQTRVGKGGALGGVEWGLAADEQQVYVANADVTFPAGEQGGLTALKLATGEPAWHAASPEVPCGNPRCFPGLSAAVSAIPGAVFAGAVNGFLRAYATDDGRVLWEFDTVRDYVGVNGVPAKGGSINGPGPTIAGGMLFTNSGYGQFNSSPGNALLAFAPE